MSESPTDTAPTPLLALAFALGFSVSREGFNGECDFEHYAPISLDTTSCGSITVSEHVAYIEDNETFLKLRGEALSYITNERSEHEHT